MPRYSMYVADPDFFVQSSNDLKLIQASQVQTKLWLSNMSFEERYYNNNLVLNIYDLVLKRNIISAILRTKNGAMFWKPIKNDK